MPVTIGSVGDIIAICLLVKDCVEALNESRGAAASYQAVIRELYILEKALLEVDLLARTYGATDELSAMFESAKAAVNACQTSLQAFKSKTRRFEPHLDPSTNRSTTQRVFKGSAMKLLWQVSMKDEVARFRAEVVAYSLSINQLVATAMIRTQNASHKKIDVRIQELQSQTNSALEGQTRMLDEIQHRLKDVNRRISAGESSLTRFLQDRFEWLGQMGNDLKALMQKIITVNLATYNSVLEIKRQLPTVNQLQAAVPSEPMFYLEDALGRVFPITLQFITCWDALHAVLEIQFRGMQGMKKVLKREYALQDRATKKDIDLSHKWERIFLPGKWVNMSMIFNELAGTTQRDSISTDNCPGCQAPSNQPPGLEIICSVCKLVYTRLVDLNEENAKANAPGSTTAHVHAPDAPDSFVQPAPQSQRPIVRPVPPSLSAKRKRDPEGDEGPSNFKRVRIISKKRYPNKDAPVFGTEASKRECDDGMVIEDLSPTKRPRSGNIPGTSVGQGSDKGEEPETNTETLPKARPDILNADSQEPVKCFDRDRNPSYFDFNKLSDINLPPGYSDFSYSRPYPKSDFPTQNYYRRRRTSPPRPEPSKSRSASGFPYPGQRICATEEDRKRANIPSGYSLKHWDPTEEPIMLLGSVFDANSLGKWIYDWTVHSHGRADPSSEMAGELWLLLVQLADKVKRAEDIMPKIRKGANREIIKVFLESGEMLWTHFSKLLKICEKDMWKAAKKEAGDKEHIMGKKSSRMFLRVIFGRNRELRKTEKLMTGMRLWSLRFDSNCEEILRYPSAE